MDQRIPWVSPDLPKLLHHACEVVVASLSKRLTIAPDLFQDLILHRDEAPGSQNGTHLSGQRQPSARQRKGCFSPSLSHALATFRSLKCLFLLVFPMFSQSLEVLDARLNLDDFPGVKLGHDVAQFKHLFPARVLGAQTNAIRVRDLDLPPSQSTYGEATPVKEFDGCEQDIGYRSVSPFQSVLH